MLLYAKLQGNLQLCDNLLVHVDLISEIVRSCLGLELSVSLPDFLDPAKVRLIRDILKKNKKFDLARDISLKSGIEVDCVWAEWYVFSSSVKRFAFFSERSLYIFYFYCLSHLISKRGLDLLEQGKFKEARLKFRRLLGMQEISM
jgi:hypothetical protein